MGPAGRDGGGQTTDGHAEPGAGNRSYSEEALAMLPIRVYRTLRRCYPASFRREYEAEMVGAFAEQVREARQRGGRAAETSIWLQTVLDLLVTATREHHHVIRQDLRYATRSLASQPGFAAVAVLSLAL